MAKNVFLFLCSEPFDTHDCTSAARWKAIVWWLLLLLFVNGFCVCAVELFLCERKLNTQHITQQWKEIAMEQQAQFTNIEIANKIDVKRRRRRRPEDQRTKAKAEGKRNNKNPTTSRFTKSFLWLIQWKKCWPTSVCVSVGLCVCVE